MPKNFPFYNPVEHQRIIHLLEARQPLAVLTATGRNPELAGGVYPFPLIEDGDFDTPSAYMTAEEGLCLASHAGELVALDSRAWRIPAKGCNVIARRGGGAGRRVVFSAHIDAKLGTPGALDNAAGVSVLLLLAELLQGYRGRTGVELLAFNGEDYYAAPGEIHYLHSQQGKLGNILLNINLDAVGYRQGESAYSLYGCPDDLSGVLRRSLSSHSGLVEGEPWYQGDHMVFVQNGVPALAITSERFVELSATITHTAKDLPELVDPAILAGIARALSGLLNDLEV